MADTADMTLCALVCSGKSGVSKIGRQFASMYSLMYVSGRIKSVLYFTSHALLNPSARPIATFV